MRTRILSVALLFLISSVCGFCQHIELGGFGSYGNFDLPPFPSTAVGVGGRVGFNFSHYLVLEGEGSYDFKHPRVQIVTNGLTNVNVTTLRMGIIHGNGGLKVQTKNGSYFLFVKGGILDFLPDAQTTTVTGVVLSTARTTAGSFTKGVLYPGGGIGFHAGPLGIRLDAGDEIYWSDGARHNLRVTFGPTIRF